MPDEKGEAAECTHHRIWQECPECAEPTEGGEAPDYDPQVEFSLFAIEAWGALWKAQMERKQLIEGWKFWDNVRRVAAGVEAWPQWKRGKTDVERAQEAEIESLRAELAARDRDVAERDRAFDKQDETIRELREEVERLKSINADAHKVFEADIGGLQRTITAEREAKEKAEAELQAVMQLAVNKWLDDDEGEPADRAARAREVALGAIETTEAAARKSEMKFRVHYQGSLRYVPCSDHRDKVKVEDGCQVCRAERAENALALRPKAGEVGAAIAAATIAEGRLAAAEARERELREHAKTIVAAEQRHFDQARELREQLDEVVGALGDLKRGDCWCEMGIGNPMAVRHSLACDQARAILSRHQET